MHNAHSAHYKIRKWTFIQSNAEISHRFITTNILTRDNGLTGLADGRGELAPQPRLQLPVVERNIRGIKKTRVSAPEVYQHAVHRQPPVGATHVAPKVRHGPRRRTFGVRLRISTIWGLKRHSGWCLSRIKRPASSSVRRLRVLT